MIQTIKGYYDNGIVILEEQPKASDKAKVFVMFVEEEAETMLPKKGGIKLGGLEGRINIPDDFDEPLDDLKEYMY